MSSFYQVLQSLAVSASLTSLTIYLWLLRLIMGFNFCFCCALLCVFVWKIILLQIMRKDDKGKEGQIKWWFSDGETLITVSHKARKRWHKGQDNTNEGEEKGSGGRRTEGGERQGGRELLSCRSEKRLLKKHTWCSNQDCLRNACLFSLCECTHFLRSSLCTARTW